MMPDGSGRLATALQAILGMDPADAAVTTQLVVAALGSEGEVEDLALSQEVRSVFYTLEPYRLLAFRRIEREHPDGVVRRHFYWHVRWDAVEQAIVQASAAPAEKDTVYAGLPREAWRRVTA